MCEAVYGPGKTPEQCAAIVAELLAEPSASPVILTRASPTQVEAALAANPGGTAAPHLDDRSVKRGALATLTWRPAPEREGAVQVVTAGTADLAVADECQATLVAQGFRPTLLADCGVAGVHRLLAESDELAAADAIVVVAGMEGALASIVAGVTAAPVIAVPTSAGYGTSFEGITALLAMLSSCAAGVVVVGIDNGFGAATAVARLLP
jgi:pyridinium-3,5-biscarboxylic acid mononucleotide synthase